MSGNLITTIYIRKVVVKYKYLGLVCNCQLFELRWIGK